ncbi:hypothetical protein Zmor_009057 [Zophobas morio]|jgi:hypothetical protein|uniref:Uncharacterized protein n=1 Tax=Zophobas morio TaxID=2755281 RepID=A0AA38LZZ8_9CUCU|nr:hypothetical protein Zmor_009057 [Zophobas morio]
MNTCFSFSRPLWPPDVFESGPQHATVTAVPQGSLLLPFVLYGCDVPLPVDQFLQAAYRHAIWRITPRLWKFTTNCHGKSTAAPATDPSFDNAELL